MPISRVAALGRVGAFERIGTLSATQDVLADVWERVTGAIIAVHQGESTSSEWIRMYDSSEVQSGWE
jgi:dsRNA-specific ribonuclease